MTEISTQFEQDLHTVAALYGIDCSNLESDELVERVEAAGLGGVWEIIQAVLYGMDYPVKFPQQSRSNRP